MTKQKRNTKGLRPPWKKGQSGNPTGRRPDIVSSSMKAATREEMRDIFNAVVCGRFEDLEKMAEGDPDSHTLQVLIASALMGAHKRKEFATVSQVLDKLAGKNYWDETQPTPPDPNPKIKTYEEFCMAAGYEEPFEKQVEMYEFGMNSEGPHMILGSRGYGKTDYVVVLGVAYKIYLDNSITFLILTKDESRNAAMLKEILKACEANGVTFEKDNSECVRVAGLLGKDHSVSTLTIGSKRLRGRHPDIAIMDDPVTEDDVSEATRKRVQRTYNELTKLTQNILIIGQPVHKYDLFESLRPLLKKMEVPFGTIPELDHDIEAQRLSGVSEESIQASYYLKVVTEAGYPLENVKYVEKFSKGDSVAFIDPSFEGGDYTALTIMHGHFEGVMVQGHLHKRAWNHCLDDMVKQMQACGVKRICFETNALGDQPIMMLRQKVAKGVGVVGKKSTSNKHSRILAAGAYANLIYLAKTSDKNYIEQVVKYEYGSKNDDAPDSLASCMEWIGLIRGKQKA